MSGEREGVTKTVHLGVTPWRTAMYMSFIVLALGLADIGVYLGRKYFHRDYLEGTYRFFNFGLEANLPTFISSFFLLGAGILILVIAVHEHRHHTSFWRHWLILGLALVLMSIEMAIIHEGVIGTAINRFSGPGEGLWFYNWYKFYIPVVLVFGLAYVRFLFHLPKKTAILFVLAGSLYLASAIGMEMVESYLSYAQLPGRTLSVLIEESGEMISIVG